MKKCLNEFLESARINEKDCPDCGGVLEYYCKNRRLITRIIPLKGKNLEEMKAMLKDRVVESILNECRDCNVSSD